MWSRIAETSGSAADNSSAFECCSATTNSLASLRCRRLRRNESRSERCPTSPLTGGKRGPSTRAAELVRELVEARDARALGRLQERYGKVVLLIVDELGFVPFDKHEGELLFNLLADRYERRSIILTSNLPFGEWVSVFQNEKLTTVPLDRLTHHSHILTTKGES